MATRIFFVDDEPSIRVTSPAILQQHGYHVIAVATVAEALRRVLPSFPKVQFGFERFYGRFVFPLTYAPSRPTIPADGNPLPTCWPDPLTLPHY